MAASANRLSRPRKIVATARGARRERHVDRYLKAPQEMHRLFAGYPEALARTIEIDERCRFSLEELAYQYPEERADPTLTPQETLEPRGWRHAELRAREAAPNLPA